MKRLFFSVQISYKTNDPLRLMIIDNFRFRLPFIFEMNGQLRIQIRSFMKTAFYLFLCKSCFFKNLRVRKNIDTGSGLFCTSDLRKQTLFQLDYRNSTLISIMMYVSFSADFDVKIGRQCIYHRGTYAVKTTTGLIRTIIKLSTRMKGGKYQTLRRYSFLMHSNRNSTSII